MHPAAQDFPEAQIARLDQSGALLRKIIETSAVGLALVGLDRKLQYVNAAFVEMLGHASADAVGMALDDLIHPDDSSAAVLHVGRLIGGEMAEFRGEVQLRHRDGDAVWGLASASLVVAEPSGRPLHVVLQVTNIDGAKRAEAALAYSESRWNSALEAGRQGVWDHDMRNRSMFYSGVWRELRGLPRDAPLPSGMEEWLAKVHPDDRERTRTMIAKQDEGQLEGHAIEYRERHRNGHYIWILSRGKAVDRFPDGKPARIIGTDTDITRLKTVEAELAEEKERLRVTLQAIGDAVISTDSERRIIMMNAIAEDMTGWQADEAVGRTVEAVFEIEVGGSGAAATSPVAECLRTGRLTYMDHDLTQRSRAGRRRDIRCCAAPVRTPQGSTIGAVLIFHDITESQALQKQLAHSASHDALTGLPNRTAFEQALAAAVESAWRESRTHALCFIDLDRFKPVNDTAGHSAGDALLKLVAETIQHNCRSADFAARLGGDEFAVVLADCPPDHAVAVAEKISAAIASLRFTWKRKSYAIGASIGITSITGRRPSSGGFIAEADAACYAAKANGRGYVVLHRVSGA